jgi:hypothetical protein
LCRISRQFRGFYGIRFLQKQRILFLRPTHFIDPPLLEVFGKSDAYESSVIGRVRGHSWMSGARERIPMKPQSNIKTRSWAAVVACCGIALALGPVAVHSKADAWNKRTVLTIDQPLQVMDTYLDPGTYVFRLLNSSSDRHIVQIYNANENHLIATILAIPDYRIQPTGKSAFRMWETPAGYAAALRDWYYPGDNFGQEFPYPKHLRQLEVAQVTQTQTTQTAQATEAAPPPPPAQAEVQQQTTVEEAQNTPPPPPPAVEQPQPAPAPAPAPPQQLPQTASHYPLIGFLGVVLIGVGGLLRRTCSA